jgi:hypothetical protein
MSPCYEPCAPCVEKCTWSCEHRGSCCLPCAAPCSRLPCNKRCSRMLSCGHQCPGICGETCPEEYCQICSDRKEARVDLLEMKSYSEIDLNETPIVVLGCGHFFTAESLDGHIGMAEVYVQDGYVSSTTSNHGWLLKFFGRSMSSLPHVYLIRISICIVY